MNQDNKQNLKIQSLIIEFDSFLYQIIVPKETTTIQDIKKRFFIVLQDQGIHLNPQFYQLYDLNVKRFLNENEIIQDIIKTFESYFIKVKNIQDVQEQYNEQLVQKQNVNELQQNLNEMQLNDNYQEEQEYINIAYRNTNLQIIIPSELIKFREIKNMVIINLKENGIIVNEHFCELINEKSSFDGEKNINPKFLLNYQEIVLEDYQEWVRKQQNQWNVCHVNQKQIKQALQQSKNINEMLNLKQTLECWTEKEKAKFKIFPIRSYTNLSRIFIIGPKNSPYQDGIYELLCKLPETYPLKPPQFYFVTEIYHPNIINGKIALDQFEENWCPTQSLDIAISQIINYLNQPNLEYTLNKESAEQYLTDKDTFNQIVEEYKNKYAKPELDDILKSLLGQVPSSNSEYSELLEEFEEWIIYWVHSSR